MRLSVKILKNIANVNQWEYSNQAYIQEGQINDVYIQLVDLDKTLNQDCLLRYMSVAASVAVEITFPSVDDDQVIVIAGSQPFTQDNSIWKFTLSSTQLPNSGAIQVKLTEDGVDKFFNVLAAIQVQLLNDGGC